MNRNCKNNPNMFCYVCGEFTTRRQRKTITLFLRNAYQVYFGCPLGDQDKSWAPHNTCNTCYVTYIDCVGVVKPKEKLL